MVRPLPNGANWTAGLLAQHGVAPGATLGVLTSGGQSNSAFPHHTEDTPIDPASVNLISTASGPWFGNHSPPTAATIADAFEGNIKNNSEWNGVFQGVHVLSGVQTRSLWAVRIRRDRLSFVNDFQKLKGVLNDGAASYKLAISSRVLKDIWRNRGLAAVNQILPQTGYLHVRVGLARAFGSPADKC